MNCYISKNYRHMGVAGDKAKTDVERILNSMGFVNIGLAQSRSTNAVTAYVRTLASVLKGVRRLKPGDVLLLQYPLKKYYDFVVRKARSKGVRVITLIHDLGSFRRKKLTVDEEVERLILSSALIVHTHEMEIIFRERVVTVPMVRLGLWDFL